MASKFVMPIGIELQYSDNLNEMLKRSETAINQFAAKVSQTAEQNSKTPGGAASSARHQIRQQMGVERAVVEERFTDKKSPEYLNAIKGLNRVGDQVVKIVEESLSSALGSSKLFSDPSQLMNDATVNKVAKSAGQHAQNIVRREDIEISRGPLFGAVETQTQSGRPSGDDTLDVAGLAAAFERLTGLAVGIEEEFAKLRDAKLGELTVAARGMLTSMREFSQSLERTEANVLMTRQLQKDPTARQELTQSRLTLGQTRGAIDLDVKRTSENVEAQGELLAGKHLLRLEEQVVKFTQMLQDSESAELKKTFDELVLANRAQVDSLKILDEAYVDQAVTTKSAADILRKTVNSGARQEGLDSGDLVELEEQRKLQNQQLKQGLVASGQLTEAEVETAIAQAEKARAVKTGVAEVERSSQYQRESNAALKNLTEANKRAVNEQRWQQGMTDGTLTEGSTWFQRLQQGLSRRQGQAPRHATDFSTGPQMLQARAMTTLGFGISGAAMYGGVQLMKDILNESTELQQELGVIEAQFKTIGSAAGGLSFETFKQGIKETAALTGVAANDVARIQRQLAGVFADPETGTADYGRAQRESQDALKYTRISGLTLDQTTDDLTAIALAFQDARGQAISFRTVLDTVTDAEYRFGVAGEELVSFTARMAPLAAELGFELEQLVGMGAIAQKTSALSGDVLSEQFGRMLPAMSEQRGALAELLAMNEQTIGAVPDLMDAFSRGEGADALAILVEQYDNLTAAQKSAMVSIVGGRREAQTLFSILRQPDQTLRALDGGFDGEGSFEERWARYEETVNRTTERLRRAAEEIGQKIFDAGLGDMITDAGNAATVLLQVLTKVFGVVEWIQEATGGWAGRIMLAVVAAQALSKAMAMMPAMGGAGAAAGGFMGMRGHGVRSAFGAARAGTGSWGGAGRALGTSMRGPAAALGLVVGAEIYSRLQSDSEKHMAEAQEAYEKALEDEATVEDITSMHRSKFSGGDDNGVWDKHKRFFGIKPKRDADFDAAQSAIYQTQGAPFAQALDFMLVNYSEELDEILGSVNDAMEGRTIKATEEGEKVLKELGIEFERDTGLDGYVQVDLPTGTITSADLTDDKLTNLARMIEEDPTNDALLSTAKWLMETFPETERILNESNSAIESNKRQAEILEKFLETKKGLVARATAAQANIDLGRLDFGELEDAYIQLYTTTMAAVDQMPEGDEEMFRMLEEANGYLQSLRNSMRSKWDRMRDFRERMRSASGQFNETQTAGLSFDDSMQMFDQISGADQFDYMDRAEAALDVLDAAQKVLDQELQDAIDNEASEEVLNKLRTRTVADVGVNDAVREAAIYGQIALLLDSKLEGTKEDMEAMTEALVAMYDGDDRLVQALIDALVFRRDDLYRAMMRTVDSDRLDEMRVRLQAYDDQIEAFRNEVAEGSILREVLDPMEAVASESARKSATDKESDPSSIISRLRIARAMANGNIVRQAEIDVQIARQILSEAESGTAEWDDAKASLIDAEFALAETIRTRAITLRQISYDIMSARAHGDSVQQARIARDAAYAALADASTIEEQRQAELGIIVAENAFRDAQQARLQAWEEYEVTIRSNNPIEAAKQAVRNAEARLARATEDQRPQALSELFTAQQNLETQWLDYWTGLMNIVVSTAEGQGDLVGVAETQLMIAQERLRRLREMGVQGAPLAQAFNEVVQATNNVETTRRQDRLGDLDYLYEFDKITADMYINMLRAEMERIPESNKHARREIERKIKGLRDEMSSDLAFNLPGEIRLPTLYEVRRLSQQQQQTPGSTYNDSRQVTINVNESTDPDRVVQIVQDAVGAPPRNGSTSRLY